jgi:hypothetical protein
LPDFNLSLWQAEQVLLMNACWEAAVENDSGFCAAAKAAKKITAPIKG